MIHLLIARGGWSGAEHGSLVSPLRSAVNAGDATAARLLLDGGADANERYDPRSGETMLHRAAKRPGLDLARTLLGHGADPNLTDAGGRAPLHVAAGEGNEGMIRMLLAHRAKVDTQDRSGWTPLHVAASRTHAEATRALLEAGADPNVRTKSGQVALQLAWGSGAGPVQELLKKAGGRAH